MALQGHVFESGSMPPGVGWRYLDANGEPVFLVCGHAWLPSQPAAGVFLLQALRPSEGGERLELRLEKKGFAAAVITLSDKGFRGERVDTAGPRIAEMLAAVLPVSFSQRFLLADGQNELRGLLAELALEQKYDLLLTCGGTGLGPRDAAPQATASLLDIELPGFGEAMRAASLKKTPNAVISRAVCGALGQCLVINLPGSLKAAQENLEAILPSLNHALAKLQGDPADCGG